MTGPRINPADSLPPLHRILTPDEFEQARQMSPQALQSRPFPVLPPAAPSESTRVGVPAGASASAITQPHAAPANPSATSLTGKAKTASDAFQGLADNPIKTAAAVLLASNPVIGMAASGLMGHDIAQYAGQKAAELTMDEETRKAAEADPTRISGKDAAMDVGLLALPSALGAAVKGGRTLAETPKLAALRGAVEQHVSDIADSWAKIWAPAGRTAESAQAAGILRATTGEAAAQYEQAAYKVDEFRRVIDPLPDTEKLAFIDAIEGGQSQATPEFQKVADTMRQTLDDAREAVRNLGTGKLESFIENYFPHIWQDPDRAATAFGASAQDEAKIIAGSKRPMEGSKSFLKQRTIPTTREGMDAGLVPVTTNPIDLTLLKLREMQRYTMAHQSLNEMKDAGLVKFVGASDKAPQGYQRIDDRIATVFGPREGAVTLPAGANISPSDVGVPGTRIMGQYYAPEQVATVVNNYLSPGLRGNAIYDAYRGLGNTLNQAQLGLSAFHLGFTSMDASVSKVSLGLEQMASGKPIKGLATIAQAPAAPITNPILGAKIKAAYLNPESASEDMRSLANAVKEAGGRVRQDSFYESSYPQKMLTAWREGAYGKAAALSLPALWQAPTHLIMDKVVPMQKLGVFGDLAKKVLAELPEEASVADRRAALGKAWDSVDNRMGQVVYDNLFWNKTVKDLSMASVRSVGWNLGTLRELGGGYADMAKTAKTTLSEGGMADPEFSHRAAYAVALPITVGLYGALYQYLRTGEGPTDLKDYFYPRTGEVDADGNPERIQLPSYAKDIAAYMGHPFETVKHKVAPLPSAIYEMLSNEDFYGDQIRNPEDPAVKQLAQEAEYAGKEFVPFGVRNLGEQNKRGDQTTATKVGNFFGVTPAPREAVRSDAQNLMAEYQKSKMPGGATPEEADARKSRADILNSLRLAKDGKDPGDLQQAVSDAIEHQQLTPKQIVTILRRAGSTPAQERFKGLTLPQAMEVFQRSTPREKAMFAETMIRKIQRAK